MDKLKSLLAAKKPQNKIIVQKQQLEKQKSLYLQRQRQQQQEQSLLAQKRTKQLDQYYSSNQNGRKKLKTQPQRKLQIPLNDQQIKTQLQKLYQPNRLQSQLDETRYRRLLRMQKIHKDYPQIDMKTFDECFYRKFKEKEYFQQLDSKYRDKMIQPKLTDDAMYRERKLKMILNQKEKDLTKQDSYVEVSDMVYIWLIKILRDWKEKLDHKHNKQESSRNSNQNIQRYFQTGQQLAGLLQVLKNKAGDKDMIISIYHIMNCCLVREYVQANNKYLDLSIGKAPWPMGVAMLSITVKRNGLKLSHVLNDEMTRKWIQGIKRLISVSQQIYPNQDYMKMVYLSVNSMI